MYPNFVQVKDVAVVEEGASTAAAPTVTTRVTFNRRRLLNVLFIDRVRPRLATLGATLEREDLDFWKTCR